MIATAASAVANTFRKHPLAVPGLLTLGGYAVTCCIWGKQTVDQKLSDVWNQKTQFQQNHTWLSPILKWGSVILVSGYVAHHSGLLAKLKEIYNSSINKLFPAPAAAAPAVIAPAVSTPTAPTTPAAAAPSKPAVPSPSPSPSPAPAVKPASPKPKKI